MIKKISIVLIVFIISVCVVFSTGIKTQSVEISGHKVYFNESGSGEKNILFVHGLFASKEQWNGMMQFFSEKGYHCYALDLPGYGQSVGYPLNSYTFQNEANYLSEFIEKEQITHVNLVGNSMGTAIVSLYTHQHFRNVNTLTYIGGAVGVSNTSDAFSFYQKTGVNPFIPTTVDQFKLELSLLFYKPPVLSSSQMENIVKMYTENLSHYQAVYKIFAQQNDEFYKKYNGKFSCPVFVIWGEQDKILIPPPLSQIKKRVENSQVILLSECGHLPMIEKTNITNQAYLNFIQSVK